MKKNQPELVVAVLRDYETAPVSERMRAVLRLLQIQTLAPERLGSDEIERARATGLSDQEIYEAMYVAFSFNMINRLANAFDFDVLTPEQRARAVDILLKVGYRAAVVPG